MKKTVKILILTLSIIFVLSCFAGCSKSDIPDGYQLIAREGDTFRIYVPTQGWMPNTSSGVTSAFFAVTNSDVGMPATSVSVYMPDDASDCESVAKYWEICEDKLAEELDEYKFIGAEDKNIKLGGEPAVKYTYSAKMSVSGKSVTYKFMQVMAIHNGQMYVLMFSGPETEFNKRFDGENGSNEHVGIIREFRFAEAYVPEDSKEFSKKEDVPTGMKLASSKERPYVLFCPEGWNIDTSAGITTVFASDKSNLTVQYIMPDVIMTVEDYWKDCSSKYETDMQNFALISEENAPVGGIEGGKVAVFSGSRGGVSYKFKQAIALKGEVIYVVTYTAIEEKFDAHTADVDEMLANFRIK